MYRINNKSLAFTIIDKIQYILLFFVTFYLIDISPQILSKNQPDSADYLFGSNTRKYLYTLIIIFCEKINLELILFQKMFLTLSLVFLFYSFKKKIGIHLTILFFVLILSNFYYTSFSKTILSESVFFSFINFSIGLLFLEKKNIKYFFLGILSGCIISTKSIGPVLGILLIVFTIAEIFAQNKKNRIPLFFLVIFCSLTVPSIEYYNFSKQHQDRETVFPHSVLGKVFLMSGFKGFKIENYPEEISGMLYSSKQEFGKVHLFLDRIRNPILKADLLADYEGVAQYQMVFLLPEDEMETYEKIRKSPMELFLDLIKNNPFEYLKISFSHYIGIWSTGSKFIFLDQFLTENKDLIQPMKNEFANSSGPMKSIDIKLLVTAQIFFLLLFANIIFLTFYFGFKLIIGKKVNSIFLFLLISLQIYLVLVSFTNIATIRYLMPLYPSIIILFVYSIKNLSHIFIQKNNDN